MNRTGLFVLSLAMLIVIATVGCGEQKAEEKVEEMPKNMGVKSSGVSAKAGEPGKPAPGAMQTRDAAPVAPTDPSQAP